MSRQQFYDRLVAERAISVQAAIAGVKGRDGKLIEVLNLDEQMDLFDVRLRRPLNYDQVREAVLREVAAS